MLTDLSRALREEERQAWQRLIRVLGHELNNSLAPIQSHRRQPGAACMARDAAPADWEDDMRRGLAVIGARAEALEPLHGRLRAAGAAAAAAAAAASTSAALRAPGGAARDAPAGRGACRARR